MQNIFGVVRKNQKYALISKPPPLFLNICLEPCHSVCLLVTKVWVVLGMTTTSLCMVIVSGGVGLSANNDIIMM